MESGIWGGFVNRNHEGSKGNKIYNSISFSLKKKGLYNCVKIYLKLRKLFISTQ